MTDAPRRAHASISTQSLACPSSLELADIGCDKCDGETGQKIPCCNVKFLNTRNGTAPPSWVGDGIVADPKWVASFDRNKMRPARGIQVPFDGRGGVPHTQAL